jgi:tripartite-type tricarboxylate transporter receptor subunit TctC
MRISQQKSFVAIQWGIRMGGKKMARTELAKTVILVVVLMVSFIVKLPTALSQGQFPQRPIEIAVPYGAGGGTDLVFRELGELAKKYLGQPIIITNKPGGGGAVGAGYVYNAKPDGYSLAGLALATITLRPLFYKVPYDIMKFTPIIQAGVFPFAVSVKKDAHWNSLEELLAYARDNPGKIKYATTGPNDINQLIVEQIARKYGIKWDIVPSATGEPAAMTMLLGGHIDFVAAGPAWLTHVKAGSMKVLLTYGGKKKFFSDVPTLLELGYDLPDESGPILVGPPGLDPKIVKTLHDAFKKAMDEPGFEEAAKRINMERQYRGSQELGKYLKEFYGKWEVIVREMGKKKDE